MKVAMLNDWMCGGGAERSMSYIANGMAEKLDCPITIYTLESGNSYDLHENIQLKPFRKSFSGKIHKLITIPVDAYRLKKNVQKNGHGVVLSFQIRSNIVNVVSRFLGAKHKVVLSERIHPKSFYSDQWYAPVAFNLISFFYNHSDVITCNAYDTELSLKDLGVNKRIETITNGYDKERLSSLSKKNRSDVEYLFNEEKINIILVGRLSSQKGHIYLLEALLQLKDRSRFNVIFLGEGPERQNLEHFVASHELEKIVTFRGFDTNPYKYISSSDVLVVPSLYEGYPNVICESLILETPVISFDFLSSPSELVTKRNGILVPLKDVTSLAQAISSFSKGNYKKIDSSMILDNHQLTEKYIDLLSSLLV